MDRDARKQVLLTRIAFERAELRRDLQRVQHAVRVPGLLRMALGAGIGPSLRGAAAGSHGWLTLGLSLLRRYRLAAALFAGVAPVLGAGRSGWGRVVRLGVVAAAAWLGWRAAKGRGTQG